MVCPRHTRHTKTPDDRQLLSRLSLNDSANMAKKVHKDVNLFIKKKKKNPDFPPKKTKTK